MTTCSAPTFGPRATFAATVLATSLVAFPCFSQEQDQAAARALFNQGRALMHEGHYAEACPKLEAARRLYASAGILLNLGDCLEKLGRTASAWTEFGEAAAVAERTHRDTEAREAEKRQTQIEPTLLRLSIRIGPGPAGVTVHRDGAEMAQAALGSAIPVDAGKHEITVSADGYAPWTTTVTVSAPGETVEVDVPALQALPSSKEAPVAAPPPHPTSLLATSEAPQADSSTLAPVGWALAGGGVAVAAGSLALMLIESSRASDARRDGNGSEYDSTKTPWAIGLAGVCVGGAAALTGAVILATGHHSTHETVGALPTPWVSASGGGLAYQGAF